MIKLIIKNLLFLFRSFIYLPHFILFKLHKNCKIMHYEVNRYMEFVLHENIHINYAFFKLITNIPDYRSVFYLRCGYWGYFLNKILPGRKDFYFYMPSEKVGNGLIIHHAISTRISCRGIGSDCQIWQLVTIGKSRHTKDLEYTPLIKNNVKISVGAIVIGNITIGNNVIIGAGAVVTKSIPDGCVVIGNPAIIIKKNGIKVYEKL